MARTSTRQWPDGEGGQGGRLPADVVGDGISEGAPRQIEPGEQAPPKDGADDRGPREASLSHQGVVM